MNNFFPLSVLLVIVSGPTLCAEPDYNTHVAPLFRKYCSACHNDEDREGGLSLATFDTLQKGGKKGSVVTPGSGETSRLVRMLSGQAKPQMPPDDSEKPKKEEVAVIKAWVDAGAKGPSGAAAETMLVTPKINPKGQPRRPITALAMSADEKRLAVARYGVVEIYDLPELKLARSLERPQRQVNSVEFSRDGSLLAASGGDAGLKGEAWIWKTDNWLLATSVSVPTDVFFDAALSPDKQTLATVGYDKHLRLWELPGGKLRHAALAHDGAINDVEFRSDGKVLATAAADRMVKLWSAASGERLDTFGQPLAEQRTLAFHPQGTFLAASGSDNRIRVWRITEAATEGANPLVESRFAHESPLLRIVWSAAGDTILSSSEDRLLKAWNAGQVTIRQTLPPQKDWAAAIALTRDGSAAYVGRLDGSLERLALDKSAAATDEVARPLADLPEPPSYGPQPPIDQLPKVAEAEPNDLPDQATRLATPGMATGRIYPADGDGTQSVLRASDVDLFRFDAKAGETWIVETNAARSGSPLDTRLEILDAAGKPVPRLLLRAVRDSELEFRGCTSDARGLRVRNYDEMLLNQYVWIGGEVVKHYRQRRGPDSDADFYPSSGSRWSYFDTSPRAHALGTPAFVVVPYPVGAKLPDNGLPIITLPFENDDAGRRDLGKDSRITFTAPADGSYLVRVTDVRGFGGEKLTYQLIVRRPEPGFKATSAGQNPVVAAGSGKEFTVKIDRRDGFEGEVRVDVTGLPPGFAATNPVVIEAGQIEAQGVLWAAADAPEPTEEQRKSSKLTARATIAGKEVAELAGTLGEIKLAAKPKVVVRLGETKPAAGNPSPPAPLPQGERGEVPEVVIAPGQTVTCQLRVERTAFGDRIQFDVNNLPHGIIVDNIGLNGVLLPEGETERTIYLTAEPWVPEQSRVFHAVAKVEGNQASPPMLIRVQRP